MSIAGSLYSLNSASWLVGGDFNEILKAFDKFGGNNINIHRATTLWNCINYFKLIDLGFRGSKYTCSNMRYINRLNLILERIDRCFANDNWIHLFPKSSVFHLPRTHSDRSSLLLQLIRSHPNIQKPFSVISMWCNHSDFPNLVNHAFPEGSNLTIATLNFEDRARVWNKEMFGNIFHRKKHILARIVGVRNSPHYPTSSFL